MENNLVVIMLLRQSNKVLNRFGNQIREKINMNITLRRMNHCLLSEGPRSDSRRSSDRELVSSWFLIEDISVVGFFAAVEEKTPSVAKEGDEV